MYCMAMSTFQQNYDYSCSGGLLQSGCSSLATGGCVCGTVGPCGRLAKTVFIHSPIEDAVEHKPLAHE